MQVTPFFRILYILKARLFYVFISIYINFLSFTSLCSKIYAYFMFVVEDPVHYNEGCLVKWNLFPWEAERMHTAKVQVFALRGCACCLRNSLCDTGLMQRALLLTNHMRYTVCVQWYVTAFYLYGQLSLFCSFQCHGKCIIFLPLSSFPHIISTTHYVLSIKSSVCQKTPTMIKWW